jgi:hypothetical protein
MWAKIRRLDIYVPSEYRDSLDEEFERQTGRDCDEAAKRMEDPEFEKAIVKALEALRKKKPIEIAA